MNLGAFSISLPVADLAASRAFYEKLGFQQIGGDASQNWLIMRSPTAIIGLFQGMFDRPMLTFNPGWDENGQTLEEFTDVREIQKTLKDNRVTLDSEADAASSGPANIIVTDPDGNPILIDQHV